MRYLVRVRGTNLALQRPDVGPQIVGFLTTRFVDATTATEAQGAAIELVLEDLAGYPTMNPEDDPVEISCVETAIVPWYRHRLRRARGFLFYVIESPERDSISAS